MKITPLSSPCSHRSARGRRIVLQALRHLLALALGWMICEPRLGIAASPPRQGAPTRIAIIGDSTVCDHRADSPNFGWGEFLDDNLAAQIVVANFAVGGASTRSFINSTRWQKALAFQPHYVLIQFGHNDSHVGDETVSANADVEYPAFLRRFLTETRAIGARPILVTPMERRSLDEAGKVREKLTEYAVAMRKVAQQENVSLIDLHAASCRLYEKLGANGVAKLGDVPEDKTHFNARGAKAMAHLVAEPLIAEFPALRPPSKRGTKAKRP